MPGQTLGPFMAHQNDADYWHVQVEPVVDEAVVGELVNGMGFGRNRAVRAVYHTGALWKGGKERVGRQQG